MKIAILGFGTVGSGVYDVCKTNEAAIEKTLGEKIEVSHILDLRSFPGHPLESLVTDDIEKIISDSEVETVCEMLGGTQPAYDFSMKAICAGKNVVTSNKAVVAKYGPELLDAARKHGVRYLFEASVGGGIPIIRPLDNALTGNEIEEIDGILNGTCNYIMTGMSKGDFEDIDSAVKKAQALGYAERDPADDIEAKDAARKICILAACATGKLVPFDMITRHGITEIKKEDVEKAKENGATVKLIARYIKAPGGKIYLSASPCEVKLSSPLAHVEDVYNAVLVRGNMVGNLMFYGSGAGKDPTASAVVADICDLIRGRGKKAPVPVWVHAPEAYTDTLPECADADIKSI